MTTVRSLIFATVFYFGSAFFAILAFVESAFFPGRVVPSCRRWAQWHRLCAKWILGISSDVEGALPQHAALVAIKHQAHFETFELLVLFDKPAVVMKKELVDIPIWGTLAKWHGVIGVDRDTGSTALRKMLKAAKAAIEQDRPIIIFPEGTRTLVGAQPPLKSGLAGLYKTLKLPIVPIALKSGHLCPLTGIIRKAGLVRWQVGDTIPAGLPREEMEARVHAAINTLNPPLL